MSGKKKRMLYTQVSMTAAVLAVQTGRMSINAASSKFKIPRSTLHSKIMKIYANKKPGPNNILSSTHENLLVEWIFMCSQRGHPVTKPQLVNSVKILIKELNLQTPFNNDTPGRSWYKGFLNLHENIKARMAENLTLSRAAITEDGIRQWFSTVENYLKEKNLLNIDSSQIFNTNETAISLNPKSVKVLTMKGNKNVYNIMNNNEKENLSVLVTGNAAGQLAPPLILFPFQRMPAAISTQMPDDWSYGKSESGWMTGENFYEYITNVFHPWVIKTKIQLPVVLYVDGHASHMTQPLSEFCFKNQIELITLHPNSTHVIQPMDQSMFAPLKLAWKKQVNLYRLEYNSLSVSKADVGRVLKKAIQSLNIVQILKNGFRACGLHPFSADAVDYSKILKRNQSEKSYELSPLNHSTILKYIEEKIDSTTLTAFRDASNLNVWSGKKEDTSLFYLWKNLIQDVKIDNNNSEPTIDISQESSTFQTKENADEHKSSNEEQESCVANVTGETQNVHM